MARGTKKTVEPATETLPATTAQTAQLPVAASDDFAQFAGAGLENVGASDLLVPRLSILQALSPQVNKRKPEYIPGAEPGMIADVGTGELFPDGLWFLAVHYRKDYIEWAPRDSGKGLVAIHADPAILDQTTRNDRNQPILPGGNYIAETAQFFGLNLTAGRRWSFIPMTSTQLKRARKWNTLATGEKLRRPDGSEFTPPLFYRTYNLTVAEESNSEGDWFGWKVERGLALPEITIEEHGMEWRVLKDEAVAFRKSLTEGRARADMADLQNEGAPTEEAM